VPGLTRRERSFSHLFVHSLKLFHREHVHTTFLSSSEHYTVRQFVSELCRQDQAGFLIQTWSVCTQKHLALPPTLSDPVCSCSATTVLLVPHFTPLPPQSTFQLLF